MMENEKINTNSVINDFVTEESSKPTVKKKSSVQRLRNIKKIIDEKEAEGNAAKLPEIILNRDIKSTGFKSLGNIIRFIAFLVAIAIVGVHVLAAYVLFNFRPEYYTYSIGIITIGLVLGFIVLFLIYALGHIANQNYEILSILKTKNNK